jgi:hypothetical protein
MGARRSMRRPSPAMVVSILALIFAVSGTAIAASALTKAEKKQVKKIASNQVKALAPGLSVARAGTADSAAKAGTADSAANASRLEGSSLAEVAPGEPGFNFECVLTNMLQPCAGFELTLNRVTDVIVVATTQWYSTDTASDSVRAHCRIRLGTSTASSNVTMGSTAHDTDDDQTRTFATTHQFTDVPAGTSSYDLQCVEDAGNIVLEETRIFGFAITS